MAGAYRSLFVLEHITSREARFGQLLAHPDALGAQNNIAQYIQRTTHPSAFICSLSPHWAKTGKERQRQEKNKEKSKGEGRLEKLAERGSRTDENRCPEKAVLSEDIADE